LILDQHRLPVAVPPVDRADSSEKRAFPRNST